MANSKEDVASQALARLGEPAISSFTEDTDTAEKVNQLYEPTILQLLSSHDWSFATKRVQLSEDASGAPVNEWTRAFLMPTLQTDRVGKPLQVFNSTNTGAFPVFGYEIRDKWIDTDYTTVVIEYINRKSESEWPGYFLTLAIEALAATLALPVTENASKEKHHRLVAYGTPGENNRGGLFRTATEADAQGDPTRSLIDDHDPISLARFGGVY